MKTSGIISTVFAVILAGCVSGNERPVSMADEAPGAAEAVVFVRQVVSRGKIHSFVKEVWRFDGEAESIPTVGAEYGEPAPYDERTPFSERNAIVFVFGPDRPVGFPKKWTTPVTEKGLVPSFSEVVYEQRGMRGNTDPDLASYPRRETMSLQEVKRLIGEANRKRPHPSRETKP